MKDITEEELDHIRDDTRGIMNLELKFLFAVQQGITALRKMVTHQDRYVFTHSNFQRLLDPTVSLVNLSVMDPNCVIAAAGADEGPLAHAAMCNQLDHSSL